MDHRRIFTDAHATDSFQNVLFPLLLFSKYLSTLPNHIATTPPTPKHLTIISHAFKRARFLSLHLPALRYPSSAERVSYVGVDPPGMSDAEQRTQILEGERVRGVEAWRQDPYGRGEVLARKRAVRGWSETRGREFEERVFGGELDEEVGRALLGWKGPGRFEGRGRLPWEAEG